MKATLSLSSVLGSNWEDMAYAGFTNIANTQASAPEDVDGVSFIGILLALTALLTATRIVHASAVLMDIQNDQGDRKEETDTVTCAATPTPSDLPNILLVDANGADAKTNSMSRGRYNFLYPDVASDEYSKNYSMLAGKGEAVKENFIEKLNDSKVKLRFVSVGGHGNINRVCGYTKSSAGLYTPILEIPDVTEGLADKKIFHFVACNTANGLGPALVNNGATAFIGYTKPFEYFVLCQWMLEPDCTIDKELIKGQTVNQAVEKGRAEYKQLMNTPKVDPDVLGALIQNCDALVALGNGNARLSQANKDEQQKSTTKDEQQKSTSQVEEEKKSASEDEQHSGEHNQIASQHKTKKGCCCCCSIS